MVLPKNLCLSCMEEKGDRKTCPHCGSNLTDAGEDSIFLTPGAVLSDKYMIGRVLGQGGFGITYLAWDLNLDMRIAVKEFFPQGLASRSPGKNTVITYTGDSKEQFSAGVESFLKEAKTLARFYEHPNIVSVRDFFKANNTAYMVMNYIEGRTLEEYLKLVGGKVSFPKMLEIMMPVMDALREVHQSGIMHRDISPDNIFIRKDGRIILIDFGAARQELQQKSRSLSVIMRVGYSPEEQYRSKGEQGPWTDVYAVAATFYRGISGQVPLESMDRLYSDTLLPPSNLDAQIDSASEEVLLKALSVRSKERYQSVDEFQDALVSKNFQPSEEKVRRKVPVACKPSRIEQKEVLSLEDTSPSLLDKVLGISKIVSKVKEASDFNKPGNPKLKKVAMIIISTIAILTAGSGAAYYYVPIYEVSIEPKYMVLVAGEENGYFTFKVKPFFANRNQLEWNTNKENIEYAKIIEFGVIEPHKAGSRIITVGTKDGRLSSACVIDVVNPTFPWNGGTYTGEFNGRVPHGKGEWSNPSGERYSGEWDDGLYHGQGEWASPSGESYVGEWKDGIYHGLGEWKHPSGEKYDGHWKDGLFHGNGLWWGPNGDRFEGIFKEGKRNGFGTYIHTDETIEKGHWTDGVQSKNYVASIDAIVTGPKFFEVGDNIPEVDKRVYRTSFERQNSRFICWELDIIFSPEADRVIKFTWIYYHPDGSVDYKDSSAAHKNMFRNYSSGVGWDSPGNWQRGTYRFVFIIDGKTIASGNFKVQ